jgi:GNAT superfamily N-acetyltransferase
MRLYAPRALTHTHVLDQFTCGEPSLDDWLRRRALANQASGASRTFVVADRSGFVRGYYCLAAGAVTHDNAPGPIRRNMPRPIPVLVLGRLAVDVSAQKCGLGADLLRDAVQRAASVAEHTGVRALLVHALDERAKAFYLYHGFLASPLESMTLMLGMR